MKISKNTFIRFCVLQAAFWSFFASMPGYIIAYMLERGMSAGTLGFLLALNMGLSFVGSLFWGRWIDRHQGHKKYFLIGTASALGLGLMVFSFAAKPLILFVLYPLFGFMMSPIATTLDSWVIAASGQVESGARSRTFGTLGYAFTMLLTGQLISSFGYRVIPPLAIGSIILAFSIALMQPSASPEPVVSITKAEKGSFRELLKARRYMLLVVIVFFVGMTIAPINNMKVLIFENVGGDVRFLGWDSFIGCLIQSPFLLFSGSLKRVSAEIRLILGVSCALGYVLLVFLAHAPFMIIAGTVLTNIIFGLLFPTMREITESSVDGRLRTTAHSLIDVAYGSENRHKAEAAL